MRQGQINYEEALQRAALQKAEMERQSLLAAERAVQSLNALYVLQSATKQNGIASTSTYIDHKVTLLDRIKEGYDYAAPRTAAGVKGGASAWVDHYAITATGHAALAPAVAYKEFVEAGVISAGPIGAKFAGKFVPLVGWFLLGVDLATFGGGFIA